MSFFFHNFTSYNGGDGAHEGVKRMVEVDSGHVQEGGDGAFVDMCGGCEKDYKK